MKQKALARGAALALAAALLLSGCTGRTSPGESSSGQTEAQASGTRVAAVAAPLEYAPELIPMPEEWPSLVEENGAYGIRAADGSVLVPAEYAFGYGYTDYNLAQLRRDTGDDMTWYTVGVEGTLLAEVNDTILQTSAGPVVFVEQQDPVNRLCQVMNLDLEPLLPEWAEYGYYTNYTDRENRFFLRLPGKDTAEFLPGEMALLEFEPYDSGREELYRDSWDLAEEEVVVVNGRALFGADSHEWDLEDLPLPALEQADWTVWTGDGIRQTKLCMGAEPTYGSPVFYPEGETPEEIYSGDWIAVPGTVTDWPEVKPVDDLAGLMDLAGEYCSAVGIDPGCMEVTEAVEGEFGVVLALNGGHKLEQGESGEDSWAHSAVLWFPDPADSGRYQVMTQSETSGFRSFMAGGCGIAGMFSGADGSLRVMTKAWGYEGLGSFHWFPLAEE